MNLASKRILPVGILLSFSLWSDALAAPFGTGTETDPFLITSREDFDQIRQSPDAHYRITANISFAADPQDNTQVWEPIPTFSGTLEGGGYHLSDITTGGATNDNVGLFGYVNEAVFRDIRLSGNATSSSPGVNVGLLAGTSANSVFTGVHVSGSAHQLHPGGGGSTEWVGLMVGLSIYDTFVRCSATGDVSGPVYVGGLAGASNSGNIDECFVDVAVLLTKFWSGGGLIGDVYGDTRIINSYAVGKVTGLSGTSGLGGLVGRLRQTSRIANSYAAVEIQGGAELVGALIGSNTASPIPDPVRSSYWSPDFAGIIVSAGGQSVPKEDLPLMMTFSDWNFSGVWTFSQDSGELAGPYLQSNPPATRVGFVFADWLGTFGLETQDGAQIPAEYALGIDPSGSISPYVRFYDPGPSYKRIDFYAPLRHGRRGYDFVVEASESLDLNDWATVSIPASEWEIDPSSKIPTLKTNTRWLGFEEAEAIFFRFRVIETE